MMKSEEEALIGSDRPTAVYKVRWFFLSILVVLQALNSFNYAGFGQVSDFYHRYFRVQYAQVDWLTLAPVASVIGGSLLLSWFSYRNFANLRRMICIAAVLVCASYSLISVAVSGRQRFPSAIIGQVANGLAASAMVAAPPIFAVTWFPNNEIGVATALALIGVSCGNIVGYILPANLLVSPGGRGLYDNATLTDAWAAENRQILLVLYMTMAGLSAVTAVIFITFLPIKPAKPPNYAEVVRDSHREQMRLVNGKNHDESFLGNLKVLFTPTFVLITVTFGIVFHVNTIELTLMSQIVRSIFRDHPIAMNTDVVSGYVMSLMAVGGFVGCLAGGPILDRFQMPQVQAAIGALACFLCSIGLLIGYAYTNIWLLGVSNGLYGLSIRICIIPLYKIAIEHAYPMAETIVSPFMVGAQAVIGVIAAEVGRLAYNYGGGLWVLITQSLWLLIAVVVIAIAKPDYKRQGAEKTLGKEGP